jgi:hypothetical protein
MPFSILLGVLAACLVEALYFILDDGYEETVYFFKESKTIYKESIR